LEIAFVVFEVGQEEEEWTLLQEQEDLKLEERWSMDVKLLLGLAYAVTWLCRPKEEGSCQEQHWPPL
jgi:hypothetical protein